MTTEAITEANPPIAGTAVDGWRYAFAAFSRMPAVLGAGMLFLLVINLALFPFLPKTPEEDLAWNVQIIGFVSGLIQGLLLTPVAIAVHRFVLLGELTPRYTLNLSDPRFMRFFYFTVVFQLILTVPSMLMMLGTEAGGTAGVVLVLIFLVMFIAAIIASLRMLILFPAIAVDAPGADWKKAMADTRGHTWRVFFIALLTGIPAFALIILIQYLLADPSGSGWGLGIVASLLQAFTGVLMLAAYAAVASKLFAAYADRLNGAQVAAA